MPRSRISSVEIFVGGSAEQLVADIQEAIAAVRADGVRDVQTEMTVETEPFSDGRVQRPMLTVYGTTTRDIRHGRRPR